MLNSMYTIEYEKNEQKYTVEPSNLSITSYGVDHC